MTMSSQEFLKQMRKLLPKREYTRVLGEVGVAEAVRVVYFPLPKMGDTLEEGKVVGLTFSKDKPTSTFVPIVYAERGGKVVAVPWTRKR